MIYRSKKNRIKAFTIGALVGLVSVLGMRPAVSDVIFAIKPQRVEAKTTSQKINDAEKEKKKLEKELKDKEKKEAELKQAKKELQGELSSLNSQMEEVVARLAELEEAILVKEEEIRVTTKELEDAIETEKWQYKCMVIRVRDMYERSGVSVVSSLLNAGSLSEVINLEDWYQQIASYDQKKFREFKENRRQIEELKANLENEKVELDGLKLDEEVEQSKISGLISQASKNIEKYSDRIDEVEKEQLAYEEQIRQKEEDLETLKKILAEEIRLSQQAANAVWRDISEVTFAEGDRYLLASLIYCEAGGEPYEGKLAVGSVVINRVLSSKYPNTVSGVIYAKKQFSPVGSGRLETVMAAGRATAQCYAAADEAMKGTTNVGNCLYFRTPIEGLVGIQIGGHIFY